MHVVIDSFYFALIDRKAREEFVKMKKERDYHRQHHNRIAQEKNNLVTFVKRYVKKLAYGLTVVVCFLL